MTNNVLENQNSTHFDENMLEKTNDRSETMKFGGQVMKMFLKVLLVTEYLGL
jgi:hypothetical protein